MTDYDIEKIKRQVGENGTDLDEHFSSCGEWASGKFRRAQYNLRDFTTTPITDQEKELVNEMAIGRHFNLTNGDRNAEQDALESLHDYLMERYGSPKMRTRGPI